MRPTHGSAETGHGTLARHPCLHLGPAHDIRRVGHCREAGSDLVELWADRPRDMECYAVWPTTRLIYRNEALSADLLARFELAEQSNGAAKGHGLADWKLQIALFCRTSQTIKDVSARGA